ncbi:MAG: hypothetical protein F4Z01_07980 [Gammaproteobacteria bacterium]|nr:hypothetical protein [Gammaproteobacteria bacterium]MYF38846.1 hypothetical protein [Gammaproteobacteria bacterium]
MGEALRNTKLIFDAFVKVSGAGAKAILPGDLVQYMREQNDPMGIWKIVGELNTLNELGLIQFDEESATWHLIEKSWDPTWSQTAV